jgi:AbrB family looped-hinge helix DNA binding protein
MRSLRILRNGNVTLPAAWRKALGLADGDYVNAEMEAGRIVLRPAKVVDAEDAWFYSRAWQEGEAEADREIAAGELNGPVTSVDDLVRELEK